MVLTHVIDSWTRDADRQTTPFYTLFFIGGLASPLFLFLAGVATAHVGARQRRGRRAVIDGRRRAPCAARGWEDLRARH